MPAAVSPLAQLLSNYKTLTPEQWISHAHANAGFGVTQSTPSIRCSPPDDSYDDSFSAHSALFPTWLQSLVITVLRTLYMQLTMQLSLQSIGLHVFMHMVNVC